MQDEEKLESELFSLVDRLKDSLNQMDFAYTRELEEEKSRIVVLEEAVATLQMRVMQLQEELSQTAEVVGLTEQDPSNLKSGDAFLFGELDGAPIEWRVLKAEDDRVLLISEKGLACRPYNKSQLEISWPDCDLRAWLNGEFVQAAFNEEERSHILETALDAVAEEVQATTDQVFCLSSEEAEAFFESSEARVCLPTPFAIAQGAWTDGGNGACRWMLRTPGQYGEMVANITSGGDIFSRGWYVDFPNYCVRPALWMAR